MNATATYTAEQTTRTHELSSIIESGIPKNLPVNTLSLALFKVFMAGAICYQQTTTPTKKGDDPA